MCACLSRIRGRRSARRPVDGDLAEQRHDRDSGPGLGPSGQRSLILPPGNYTLRSECASLPIPVSAEVETEAKIVCQIP
jgi:hypothetical protein